MRTPLLILVLFLAGCGGASDGDQSAWSAEANRLPDEWADILLHADLMEMLSLYPAPRGLLERAREEGPENGPIVPQPMPPSGGEDFHHYPILGRKTLTPVEATECAALIQKTIANGSMDIALCFNPRHGLIATRNGRTLELVICFECIMIRAYGPDGTDTASHIGQTRAVADRFDAILRTAGITLAPEH